jgi:hypothetical protein
MISTPVSGFSEGANVEPCQPGLRVGKAQSLFDTIPLHLSGAAQPAARARWRPCLAFSLAFRLLARIVLLDLAVFITRGSDLDEIGPFLRVSFAHGKAR